MDFFDTMDNKQKIFLGVALVTLVIALVLYFTSKDSKKPMPLREPEPMPLGGPGPEPMPMPMPQITPINPEDSDKVLVMFFAPWCGHCKNMEPTWHELAQNFDGYNGVKILKINGDENQQLAGLHGVGGFPTVKYCPKGLDNPDGVTYNGDRSFDSLVQFLQQNA